MVYLTDLLDEEIVGLLEEAGFDGPLFLRRVGSKGWLPRVEHLSVWLREEVKLAASWRHDMTLEQKAQSDAWVRTVTASLLRLKGVNPTSPVVFDTTVLFETSPVVGEA